MPTQQLLIVGATGLVGRHLDESMRSLGFKVQGTYSAHPQKGLSHLDLAHFSPEMIRGEFSHAIITASATNIEYCFQNQTQSRKINVDGTLALLRHLKTLNVFPIFLSTDYVFEGDRGNYREEDPRNPITIYGKQKKEVEDFLLSEFSHSLILRLGKVVSAESGDKTFLTDWVEKLRKKESITVTQDQISCLLNLGDIAGCVQILLDQNRTGVYHLASKTTMSRLQIAENICGFLGFDSQLLNRRNINELGLTERRPLNTSLNSEKFCAETRFSFTDLEELLRRMKN